MIPIFHRTHGMPILRMMNFHSAIHIRQLDVRATVSDLASQVVPNELVMVYM